jgi:hypothetical protein
MGAFAEQDRELRAPLLLERLAALVPPPRRPLLAYHGLLAPRARWRAAIVPPPVDGARVDADACAPRRWTWARLLRRVFAIEVLVCDRCGARGGSGRGDRPPRRAPRARRPRPGREATAGAARPRRLTRARSRPPRGAAVPVCSPARRSGSEWVRALPRRPSAAVAWLTGRALPSGLGSRRASGEDGGGKGTGKRG